MISFVRARLRQGYRTIPIVDRGDVLPAAYRGRPSLAEGECPADCRACVDACPTGALTTAPLAIDLGKCLFCPACAEACLAKRITWTRDHRLAARARDDLHVSPGRAAVLAAALEARTRRLFKRALRLRQVSAGGCNGCEAELNVSGNIVFDLSRFGVQFVASPRHADGVVVTGPVPVNMHQALLDTYAAVPSPRLVIAVGACAISGGVFAGSPVVKGIPADMPIDLYVPGCPPHPLTFVDGVLRLLGRLG